MAEMSTFPLLLVCYFYISWTKSTNNALNTQEAILHISCPKYYHAARSMVRGSEKSNVCHRSKESCT